MTSADPTDHQAGTMACMEYDGAEGPEVLRLARRAVPVPGPGEVLVKVAAAGINRADLLQRAGHYPPPEGASDLPGLEVSGTVASVGEGVQGWEPGTEVCALLAGGGYAEYVAVPAPQLARVPEGVSLVEAASLVEVAATCWSNLVMRAGVQAGDWVLVHGGTGGIGSFALQLLAALGARPLATAGSAAKVARCRDLGAVDAVDYHDDDLPGWVDEVTEGHGADVILDVVGAAGLPDHVQALAEGGRLVVIGMQKGTTGELDLAALMAKGAWVTGSKLRSQPVERKGRIMEQVARQVWPLVADGAITPQVDRVFPLAQAAAAQEHLDTSERGGKVLLQP